MKHGKKILSSLLAALLLPLSGCGGTDIEQYFSLPRPAGEYSQLQQLIDEETAQGWEFSAPTGGSHRQSTQLHDLNGDGIDEALVFFRNRDGGARVVIYTPEQKGYQRVLTLDDGGTGFAAVDYADLNGDGKRELCVAWSLGAQLKKLSVYDLNGWGGGVLLTEDCSSFLSGDLDGDGRSDLAIVRRDAQGGSIQLCTFALNSEPTLRSARLSAGVSELKRLRTCTLEGNTPALLAESLLNDGTLVTDLFAVLDGNFFNIMLDSESGVSRTKRDYLVYAQDIDGDHFLEIPTPVGLFSQRSGDGFRALVWNGCTRYGRTSAKLTTYHCYADGWFLVLPQSWLDSLTVRREDSVAGERSVVLSDINRSTGEIADKLIIYTLTGETRSERAGIAGRFVLYADATTTYAARILTGYTEEEVTGMFHLIHTEWSNGSL